MKNKLKIGLMVLFTLIIFTTSLVLGSFGGESILLYSFEDPSIIEIEVSAEQIIDQGEYSLRDCNEIELNEWRCITTEPFDLILDTELNTVNNYSFDITYYYSEDCPDYPSGGGGGTRKIYIEVPGETKTITITEYEECEDKEECSTGFTKEELVTFGNKGIIIGMIAGAVLIGLCWLGDEVSKHIKKKKKEKVIFK